MRWQEPKPAELRTFRRFLWLPLTINYQTRWMETATFEERYCDYAECWFGVRWLDSDNKEETK